MESSYSLPHANTNEFFRKLESATQGVDRSTGAFIKRKLLGSAAIASVDWERVDANRASGVFTSVAGNLLKQSTLTISGTADSLVFIISPPSWIEPIMWVTKIVLFICIFIPPAWPFLALGVLTFWQYARAAKVTANRIVNELNDAD